MDKVARGAYGGQVRGHPAVVNGCYLGRAKLLVVDVAVQNLADKFL